MKNFLQASLILLCILLPASVKAQHTFAPAGAEWYYSGEAGYWFPIYSYLHLTVTGDTTIDGISCRKIEQEGVSLSGTTLYDPLYVYDNPDTVFVYNRFFHRFTPLYVFNVNEGDTVCLPFVYDIYNNEPMAANPYSGDTSFCFVIDSIRMRQYDTTSLKTFYTHAVFESQSGIYPIYNWNYYPTFDQRGGGYAERIGGIRAGLLPRRLENWVEKPTEANTTFYDMRCYHEEGTAIKMLSGPCDTMYTLDISGFPAAGVSLTVYPNPAGELLHITLGKVLLQDIYIRIIDFNGKEIGSTVLPASHMSGQINTGNISNGLYLLELRAGGQKSYQKIVIHH